MEPPLGRGEAGAWYRENPDPVTLGPPQNLGRTAPRPCLCLTPYTLGPVSRPSPALAPKPLPPVGGWVFLPMVLKLSYLYRQTCTQYSAFQGDLSHEALPARPLHVHEGHPASLCHSGSLGLCGPSTASPWLLVGCQGSQRQEAGKHTHTHTYTLGVSCPPWCLLHQGAVASPFQGQGLPGQSHSWPQLSRGGCSVPVWWGGWSLAVEIPGRGQSLRASPTAA